MRPQEAWALIKQVQGMVQEGWHPHYTSTYCIHELHEDCRLTCKTCQLPCLCPCHAHIDGSS